jgi:hypothetical protein
MTYVESTLRPTAGTYRDPLAWAATKFCGALTVASTVQDLYLTSIAQRGTLIPGIMRTP